MSNVEKKMSLSKLDPVQLRQRIIFLQAELSKYEQRVNMYQNNYHYSQYDQLQLEINNLNEEVAMKENENNHLKERNIRIEEEVKQITQKFSEINELCNEKIKEVEALQEHCDELKIKITEKIEENLALQKNLDNQEEEVMKLRNALASYEQEKSIFKPKKATINVKKEMDGSESWFLRTIKQQNKEEK